MDLEDDSFNPFRHLYRYISANNSLNISVLDKFI